MVTARVLFLLAALAGTVFSNDLLSGYRIEGLHYAGPGEWRHTADPIWVFEYHTLRLSYRASGVAKTDRPVLTLRPGAVGPVTPGADNPENPFAAGLPLVVITARDLVSDGALHTLEVELRGRTRTAQIDQLLFQLPAGAQLDVEALDFRAAPEVFPCAAGGPPLPADTRKLVASGESTCAAVPATSLRGRESIRIAGAGQKGGALYLSLLTNLAGVSSFAAGPPFDRWRWKQSSDTGNLLAHLRYADGFEEDQFPLQVDGRRHLLLNRQAALYALALDPARVLVSVELRDRSPHFQLAVFGAGISPAEAPRAADDVTGPPPPSSAKPAGKPGLRGSQWYQLVASDGKPLSGKSVRPDFHLKSEPAGRVATLSLTNVSRQRQKFTLVYPSLDIRPSPDAADVYYVFPQQGAVIGRQEQSFEADYSGVFPLQFVDVFAPSANCGAGVVVRDTAARGKHFRLHKTGATVRVEVLYTVTLEPGETQRYPDVEVSFHGGDWHQGFAAYRRWVASWYKPRGPRPAWLRAAFWARRDYPVGGTGHLFDERANHYRFCNLIRNSQALGGADFIDLSGWALSKSSGRVGDYPIELGGPEDLARNVASARSKGVYTGLYFEGYLMDKGSRIGRHSGAEWQIIDATGRPKWWKGEAELFVCPYVQAWQQYLSGRVSEVARQVGAGAVYLDEYGFGHQRCYSTTHGHPPGVGTMQGELAMVHAVRRALDAAGRSETMLYIEETPPMPPPPTTTRPSATPSPWPACHTRA